MWDMRTAATQATYFIYSGNKDTYGIFKTAAQTAFFFPQNAVYFTILSFFCFV
jgi:hypothetical protein